MEQNVIDLAREIYVRAVAHDITNAKPAILEQKAKHALQAAKAFFSALPKG